MNIKELVEVFGFSSVIMIMYVKKLEKVGVIEFNMVLGKGGVV